MNKLPAPANVMTVNNAALGRELSDIVHRSLVDTGKLPAELEDLLTVTTIVVDGQTRYIVNPA